MAHSIGIEAKDQTRNEPAGIAARDSTRERMRRERRQRKRQEQRDVIREDGRSAEPLNRRRDQPEAHPMIGQRERAVHRIEEETVPPRRRERQMVRVPPEKPDAEQRIAEVVRQYARRMQNQPRKYR